MALNDQGNIDDDGKPELVTERLRLTRLTFDDADLMLAIWNDPDFIRGVRDYGRRSIDDAHKAFEEGPMRNFRKYGYGQFRVALGSSNEAIGTCGLFKREELDDPDIGFAFLPAFRQQGYAYEAAVAVLNYAKDEVGLGRVTAIVSPDNAGSIRLIKKLGLQYRGSVRLEDDDINTSLYAIEFGNQE